MEKEEPRYYIIEPGAKRRGPFLVSHLRQWAREGRIGPDTAFSLDGRVWVDGHRMLTVFPNAEVEARVRASRRREFRAPQHSRRSAWVLAGGAIVLAGLAAPLLRKEQAGLVMRSLGIPEEDALRFAIAGLFLAAGAACAWLARGLWRWPRKDEPATEPQDADR
jgi:hypothetical protein